VTEHKVSWCKDLLMCKFVPLTSVCLDYQRSLCGMSTWPIDNIPKPPSSYVSALTTQMFYPIFKVPQLHLKCSHCNHTITINSNRVGRLMHVTHSATGSIAQILENHMCHQSQQVCGNCNAPLETKIHFSDPHKIYAVDVTDRHVTSP
jgi:hypothetical protein